MVIIQGEERNLELDFPVLPNRSTSSKVIHIPLGLKTRRRPGV